MKMHHKYIRFIVRVLDVGRHVPCSCWSKVKRQVELIAQQDLLCSLPFHFQDGRKMGYGAMHGIPMVATSPVRHDSPVGMNPIEIQSYEPPWKALTDFALHTDLDRLNPNAPHFQHLVNQVSAVLMFEDGLSHPFS